MPSDTTIYLVRHAQSAPSDDLPEPEWPLSDTGRDQAEALVPALRRFRLDALYASPYPRARATIEPLANALGLPIEEIHDLRERKLSSEPLRDGWLDALTRVWRDPDLALEGGESNRACRHRVVTAVDALAKRHPGDSIAAASHGNAIALFLESIDAGFGMDEWRAMRNPDVFRIVYRDGRATWDGERLPAAVPARAEEELDAKIARLLREDTHLAPWNPAYPEMFRAECEHLRASLPAAVIGRIEHFGSTAIPGIDAKPVIDMLVEVSSLDAVKARVVPVLEAKGYDYVWRPTGADAPPWYAWFIKRNAEGRRTHHIHMIEAHFAMWERLHFRDYLCAFPDQARRYAELKRQLSKTYPNDREAYTAGKTSLVLELTEKAKGWAGVTRA